MATYYSPLRYRLFFKIAKMFGFEVRMTINTPEFRTYIQLFKKHKDTK